MKQKKVYLEILRIVALFWVIFNHTQANGFDLYTQMNTSNPVFFVYLAISVFCKMAVPTFFAISGALLLTRQESLKEILKKRVLRIVVVLVVFSFAYFCVECILGNAKFSLRAFAEGLLSEGGWNYSYWYLYAYVMFLILLPILRSIAKNMSNNDFRYLFLIHLLINCILPVIIYLVNDRIVLNKELSVTWIAQDIFIYPLLGYYMEERMDIKRAKKYLQWLWIANVLGIALSCLATYKKALIMGYMNDEVSQTFFSSFAIVNCFTMWVSVKCLYETLSLPQWVEKIIVFLGANVFGAYLVHLLVLSKNSWINQFWDYLHHNVRLNFMLEAFIGTLVVMIISGGISICLRFIPKVNKLI